MRTKIITNKDEKGYPLTYTVKHPVTDFEFNSYYKARIFRNNYDCLEGLKNNIN